MPAVPGISHFPGTSLREIGPMRSSSNLLKIVLVVALCAMGVACFLWRGDPRQKLQANALAEIGSAAPAGAVVLDKRIGMQIEDFTLDDFYGQPHSLSDFADRQLVVVAFLGTDCPLVQQYTPLLMQLAERFGEQQVAFLGINSNRQDSITEMHEFADSHALTFPLLKDPGNVVADRFQAVRTPEIYVLDRERQVRYWGRVDDRFGIKKGIGYQRLVEVRPDLEIAIQELLAGKPVTQPVAEAWGCHIGRIRESDPDSPVTWSKDIAPIFQARCQSCHRPDQIAPFSLLTYEEVHGWEPMIQEVVDEGRMPPWHASPRFGEFANDPSLTQEEKRLLNLWIQHGAPEGNPDNLPPPRVFKDGWQIKDPDLVIHISDAPVVVPATGAPEFRYYLRDTGFTEGKWVEIECRPDNLSVIHHMDILLAPEGNFDQALRSGRVLRLSGYVPGIRSVDVAEPTANSSPSGDTEGLGGGGRFIPAGSQLSFEMHYAPNGREQLDFSSVAFKFLDPPNVRKQEASTKVVATGDERAPTTTPSPSVDHLQEPTALEDVSVLVEDTSFCIPPGADNFAVDAWYTFEHDSLLTSLHAHMHLRGKSMRFEAYYPNGEEETLLWVPRYDYDWQHVYQLAEIKTIPRGTRVHVIAHFDNSKGNPRNPAPEATVVYGRGYYDEEMMAGTLNFHPLVSGRNSSFAEQRLTTGQVNRHYAPEEIQTLLAGYTKLEAVDPSRRPAFYHRRGMYRECLGDLAGAVEDYTAAIATDSSFIDAYQNRGSAYIELHQARLALNDFNKVIRLDPNNANAYIQRARLNSAASAAMADFARAIALSPHDPEAYYQRGLMREAMGDIPGAIEDYTTIIEDIHPGFTEAYLHRGRIMLLHGSRKLGLRDFDTIVDRWPTRKTKVDYYLGTTYFDLGQFEEAIPELESFLRVVPGQSDVHRRLGIALVNVGRMSDAVVHLQRGLENRPDDIQGLLYLAVAYRGLEKDAESFGDRNQYLDLAIGQLKEVVRIAPEHLQALTALSETLVLRGEISEAIAHYRKILAIDPKAWAVTNNLAWLLATTAREDLRNAREAVKLAKRLCKAFRNSVPGHLDTLAAAYAEAGRFEEARSTAARAIKLARKAGNEEEALRIGERLRLYQQSQPYRDAATSVDP